MVGEGVALYLLNRVSAFEGGVARVLRGLSFGPDPRNRLDIYVPQIDGPALPVVFFIYGGGWDSGEKADYEFIGRAFAGRGFVTVIADYRVVPAVQFPGFVEDGGLALGWVAANIADYGGSADRIYLMGHSAGAYNAAMLGLDPARFGAGVLAGRIKGVVGLSGPYDFYPFDVDASIAAFAGVPDPERTQPVNLVTSKAPPMFLGHGTRDRICLPRNSKALAAQLRTSGVSVVERHYQGIGHVELLLALFPYFRWRAPVFSDVLGFLGGAEAESEALSSTSKSEFPAGRGRGGR